MAPYVTAQVLCGNDENGRGWCDLSHIGPGTHVPQPLSDTWPDIRGFLDLQRGNSQWINGDALDKALQVYHGSLPSDVRDTIHVAKTDLEGLFDDSPTTTYDAAVGKRYGRLFRQFARTKYSLWPINVNGLHWELVFMQKSAPKSSSAVNRPGEYSRIARMAVIDSWRGWGREERSKMVDDKLHAIFAAYDFEFSNNHERDIWVPAQEDVWSCGPRVFWGAKELMSRIASGDTNDDLWADLDGWANPEASRWEMVGLNGYQAIKDMDYRARVSVELVSEVAKRDSGGAMKSAEDAANRLRPKDESQTPSKRMPKTQTPKTQTPKTPTPKKTPKKQAPKRQVIDIDSDSDDSDMPPGKKQRQTKANTSQTPVKTKTPVKSNKTPAKRGSRTPKKNQNQATTRQAAQFPSARPFRVGTTVPGPTGVRAPVTQAAAIFAAATPVAPLRAQAPVSFSQGSHLLFSSPMASSQGSSASGTGLTSSSPSILPPGPSQAPAPNSSSPSIGLPGAAIQAATGGQSSSRLISGSRLFRRRDM
ncbi:hypothetical protein GGR52DRAFT_547048 [Hypoxylon sp. FL1284]|nr:hypothetical protein GGR52DRAFT_547048 [Hypoxylon sp. FL1284]